MLYFTLGDLQVVVPKQLPSPSKSQHCTYHKKPEHMSMNWPGVGSGGSGTGGAEKGGGRPKKE